MLLVANMEDLDGADTAPVENGHLPEGNDDPQDPLRPEIEEEDATKTPPVAAPTMDMEENVDHEDSPDLRGGEDDSDDELLSEVDEAQFEDFDPNAIALDERRVVDASDLTQLGKHKRKRAEGDGEPKKKRKEGRRDKPKKKRREDGDEGVDSGELSERRSRKHKEAGERRKRRTPSPENDEHLTPEERKFLLLV